MNKILVSLLMIGMVAAVSGAGTLAYFSDTEMSSDNTFTAGNLDMAVWDYETGSWKNENPASATWESPSDWAPGDTCSAKFKLKNTGNIDITYLLMRDQSYQHYGQGDGSDLGNAIEVTEIEEYLDGTSMGAVDGATYENWMDPDNNPAVNGDGNLTLKEFLAGIPPGTSGATDNWDILTGMDRWSGDEAIPVGSVYALELTFKFMEDAGNEYQEDTCSFDFQAYGTQAPSEADLPSYVE